MNYLKAGIFFTVCWLVQTTLIWRIWPFGAAAPSLLFCAAVCFAWLYDEYYSLVYAAGFGILLDLQVQTLVGVQGLAFVLCCIPAFLLRMYFNPERLLPFLVAAILAAPINLIVVWGVNRLFGSPAGILFVLPSLPELIISQTIICLILHLLFVRTIIKDKRDRRYIGGVM